MIKNLFLVLFLLSGNVLAYVPTVESLFRHGGNADITSNTITMTLKVTRPPTGAEDGKRAEDFYKLYLTKGSGDSMKISQTRYANNSFSESSLEHKIYYPNFIANTMTSSPEHIEKGIFFALLKSLTFNDGEHLVRYLKALGVPVKLNNELINRDKIEFLANYKRYLIATNRDRKKNEANPLRPEDPTERARVEKIMGESMYVDTKQVKLTREANDMAWMVNAGPFEAVVSYEKRHPIRIKYRSGSGEFEIICSDYWLSNGTHYMPKTMTIKNFNGETFQVDIGSFRHFTENEGELVKRLQKWDQILRGKESTEARAEFLF